MFIQLHELECNYPLVDSNSLRTGNITMLFMGQSTISMAMASSSQTANVRLPGRVSGGSKVNDLE